MITKVNTQFAYNKPVFTANIVAKKPVLDASATLKRATFEKILSLKSVCNEIFKNIEQNSFLLSKIVATHSSVKLSLDNLTKFI